MDRHGIVIIEKHDFLGNYLMMPIMCYSKPPKKGYATRHTVFNLWQNFQKECSHYDVTSWAGFSYIFPIYS